MQVTHCSFLCSLFLSFSYDLPKDFGTKCRMLYIVFYLRTFTCTLTYMSKSSYAPYWLISIPFFLAILELDFCAQVLGTKLFYSKTVWGKTSLCSCIHRLDARFFSVYVPGLLITCHFGYRRMSHTYRMSHVLTYILTSGRAEEFEETEGNKILEAFAGVYMSHLDFFLIFTSLLYCYILFLSFLGLWRPKCRFCSV